jgi:hypothetical protein
MATDTSLKNKLIEIVVDKLLIGALILLIGFLANKGLERYKLIEAQRVGDTSEYVKACSEIWSKLYAYESSLDSLDRLHRVDFLYSESGGSGKKENAQHYKEIADLEVESRSYLHELEKITDERKFVVGQDAVFYFFQYAGIVKSRADARKDCRNSNSPAAQQNSCEVEKIFTQQLISMRFSATAAREMALAKLP